MNVNNEYILSKGYMQYDKALFDSDGVETKFQKRFDDELQKVFNDPEWVVRAIVSY